MKNQVNHRHNMQSDRYAGVSKSMPLREIVNGSVWAWIADGSELNGMPNYSWLEIRYVAEVSQQIIRVTYFKILDTDGCDISRLVKPINHRAKIEAKCMADVERREQKTAA